MALDFEKQLNDALAIQIKEKEKQPEKATTFHLNFETLPIRRGITEILPLMNIIKDHGIICGGYARYALSEKKRDIAPPNDVDVYCPTEESFEILKKKFIELTNTTEEQTFIKRGLSLSLKEKKFPNYYGPPIQLIRPIKTDTFQITGAVEEILSNFDFTIARAAIITEKHGIADKDFIKDDNENRIVIKKVHCPISTMSRIAKYSKKGYRASAEQWLNLMEDWDKKDPEYKKMIRDNVNKLIALEYKLHHNSPANKEDLKTFKDNVREEQSAIYEILSID